MRTRPIEYLGHFLPIVHFLERHLLYRSTCDNHAVVKIILHLVKVFIEFLHMLDRRVLGRMAFYLHKVELHLQGVLLRRRTRSVSVVIFSGIKFSTTTRSGRMSCSDARNESITKMCSFFNSSTAGKFFCRFKGIFFP